MLSSRADALLRVARAPELPERVARVGGAEEDRLELVHPGVGEEEGGVVVGDDGARLPVDVGLPVAEEVDEGLADAGGRPLVVLVGHRWRRWSGVEESGGGGGGNPNPKNPSFGLEGEDGAEG